VTIDQKFLDGVRSRLLHLASVPDQIPEPTVSAEEMDRALGDADRVKVMHTIFDAFATIWFRKSARYGSRHRLDPRPDLPGYQMKMLYSDIDRKFHRLQTMVWRRKEVTDNELLETLSDLSVSAAIAVLAISINREEGSCRPEQHS
jgi:hypothetical protein